MKNIVICCDGTSNDFSDHNTNVVKLFAALEKNSERQVIYYDPGVGTPSSYDAFSPITRKLKLFIGLCFGYGLSDKIMEAYKFLMETFEEDDQLYFFGFSRGAYAVRALAGLIDTCGLLHANSENLVPEAMRIYHNRKNVDLAKQFKETFSRECPIHFLGLWDTVSSVGRVWNPVTLQGTFNNGTVKNIRHAISIDERRAFFRQNLWGTKYEKTQDIKQVWFAGVHCDVGGSYFEDFSNLSNIALEWMMVEAKGKGLVFDPAREEAVRKLINKFPKPFMQAPNRSLKGIWYIAEVWPKLVQVNKGTVDQSRWVSQVYCNFCRYRFMPAQNKVTIHETVLLRLQERDDYRPKNLMGICGEVKSVAEKVQIEKWVRL